MLMRIISIFQYITVLFFFLYAWSAKAQSDVYVSYLTDSSADFQQAYKTADVNRVNYGFISTAATTGTSYLRGGFASNGAAGNAINIVVQGGAEQTLTTAILNQITIHLYDASGTNVASATGSGQLELYQLSSGNKVYAVRFVTNAAASYAFKEVRVEISGLLSAALSEFRIYGMYYQQSCPPVFATGVAAYGTNTPLAGYVDNPAYATDASTTNAATLTVPLNLFSLLPPAYLDLNFSVQGKAGEYVGFTVSQATTTLSAALLANINMEVYNSAGTLVASKDGFVPADLKASGSNYTLGFLTSSGSYNIARIKIILIGATGQSEDIYVYNGFHYAVNSKPVAITTPGLLHVCGGSITLTATDPSGGTSFLWSNGSTSNSTTITTTGVYSVQVSDGESCTRYSIPVTVSIFSPAVKPVIVGDTAQCLGSGGTLHTSSSYSGYLWNAGSTSASIATTGAGLYSVTVTDVNGCTARDSVLVTISTSLHPVITGDTVLCTGVGGTLSTTTTYASYLWNTAATTATLPITGAGTYNVQVTNAAGCVGRDTVTVTTSSALHPVITGDTVLCTGMGGSLHTTAIYASYLWSTGATTAALPITTPGTYSVKVTNAAGCTGRDTIIVTTAPPIYPVIVGDTVQCSGIGGTLHTAATYGSYLWSTGATTPSIATTSAGQYYVTVTSPGSCVGHDTVMVTILPFIKPLITGDTALCPGTTGVLHTAATYTAYLWSTGSISPSITITSAGPYNVRVTDANGCIGRDTVIVTVTPLKPVISGDTILCPGSSGTLHTIVSYSSYLWNTGATTASIGITAAGVYTVSVTNAAGCIGRDTVVVTVLPPLHPVIVGDTVQCPGVGGTLHTAATYGGYLWNTGATTASITTTGPGLYYVTVGGASGCPGSDSVVVTTISGTPPVIVGDSVICHGGSGMLHTSISYPSYSWSTGNTSASVTISNAGQYYVSVPDASGCILRDTITVNFDGINILIDSAINVGCLNNASGRIITHAEAGVAPYSYAWSNGATTSSISGLTAGAYSVIATDALGCKDTTQATLTQAVAPSVTHTLTDIPCFGGASGTISSTVTGGSGNYTYTWSNGGSAAAITGLTAGRYTLHVKDNTLECTADDTVILSQPSSAVTIQIVSVNETCTGNDGSISITAAGGVAPYTYTAMGVAAGPTVSNLAAGQYIIMVADANNCKADTVVNIDRICDSTTSIDTGLIRIHNVITPNGDGQNDFLIIDGISQYKNASLQILDKWGDVVYAEDNYHNTWAGTDKKGNDLASGTYYYLVKLNAQNTAGGKSNYTGYIMIQR